MRQILRKIRAVPFAAVGSVLLYSKFDSDSISVFAPSVSLTLQSLHEIITSFVSPRLLLYGNASLFLSRDSFVPSVSGKTGDGFVTSVSGETGDGSKSIANAAAMVAPCVVRITVPLKQSKGMHFGSGIIIDSDGTILTCAHFTVDSQGTKITSGYEVYVTLKDGREFVGTMVYADIQADIAIVKIKSKEPLPAAKLGSSCKLCDGESVFAIGSPLSLPNTVTAGIVSCRDRSSIDMGHGGILTQYIQVDCPINKGNSGGPLVNLDGEVVGVNVMSRRRGTGLHFAVPVDSISKILEHFKRHGRIVRPWLGFKMVDLNELMIAHFKERDTTFPNVVKGVLVAMVTPGSPADRAGFHLGDVVIELEGKPVGSIREIIELLEDKVGTPLKGWNSLDTVIAAERLALTVQSAGNLREAQELLERCLDARKTLLPEGHIQIAANMLHIARVVMLNSNRLRNIDVSEAVSELDRAKDFLGNSLRIAQQVLYKLTNKKINIQGETRKEGHAALVVLLQSLNALALLEINMQELQQSTEHGTVVDAENALRECILSFKKFGLQKPMSESPEVKAEYLSCLKHLTTLISDGRNKSRGEPTLQELKDEIKNVEAEISRYRKR